MSKKFTTNFANGHESISPAKRMRSRSHIITTFYDFGDFARGKRCFAGEWTRRDDVIKTKFISIYVCVMVLCIGAMYQLLELIGTRYMCVGVVQSENEIGTHRM